MYKIKCLKNEEESAIIHISLCAYLVMVAQNNIEKVSCLQLYGKETMSVKPQCVLLMLMVLSHVMFSKVLINPW